MAEGASDFTIQEGRCWWCGAPADSREHRLKASDLVREYGKPPFTGLRTLTRFSGDDRHDFTGPKSNLVKFSASLCQSCNNARSQPFDNAWDTFTAYLARNESRVVDSRTIDWSEVFGRDWEHHGQQVERYLLKHIICRLVDQAPGPISVAGEYIDFLNGGARPSAMEVDLAIDLAVVEMLRLTRAAPPEEQPDAAEGGFLGTTALWVQRSQSTGQWSEPQAGIYYRYLGIFWRLGVGTATPFDRRVITLDAGDQLFGADFRQALASRQGRASS